MNGKTWEIPEAQISEITGKVYTLNGKSYCRVTNTLNIIAKNGLFSWYQSVGKKKAEAIIKDRQIIGTKVHSAIEHTLLGDYDSSTEKHKEILKCVQMFKIFKYNTNLSPQALEQRLWNDEFGYAGTCDYIGKYTTWNPYCMRGHKVEFKDDLVIIDWKTSRSIYKDYWLQMAAYAYAFYKLTGVKVKGAVIVQFRNEQIKVQEKTWDDLIELFEVYKAVLTVYRWNYNL
jgi:hypothetical protein